MLEKNHPLRPGRAAAWLLVLPPVAIMAHLHRPPSPDTVLVARRPIAQRLVVSGRVMTARTVRLGPVHSGRVARVDVEAGDAVAAHARLFTLESDEADAAIAKAEAKVAQARAYMYKVANHDLRIAEQRFERTSAELRLAQTEHRRVAALAKSRVMTPAQQDVAVADLARARANRESARLRLDDTRRTGAAARTAAAAWRNAKADLAAARARRSQMTIRAPAAGVVLARNIEPGDVVSGGHPSIQFASHGPTRLRIKPDERALAVVRVGQTATVSADAFTDEPFSAAVDWVAPAVDKRTGTIEVRLRVDAPPPYLKPDMTVSVAINVGRDHQALVLPSAVVHDRHGAQPWVTVLRDGATERRPVRLGLVGESHVQILDGLSVREAVVLPPASGPSSPKTHPWD